MKLNSKAFALTSGIIMGLSTFIATIWLKIIASGGETIILLKNFFIGYTFSIIGAFIGLFWGFIYGLIIGFIFAYIYNLFVPKEG